MKKDLLFGVGLSLLTIPAFAQTPPGDARLEGNAPYSPTINAADFEPVITNKYYTLNPGMKASYEQQTARDLLLKEVHVSGETKQVMGITTLVVQHWEWLNGRLIENTKGWVAQDVSGNVWYFGEAVEHYKDGKLLKNDESWEAGVDGAKPGIRMFGDPKQGATYRREYHPGKAEDMGTVMAVGVSLAIPQGPLFQNCVHLREWSPLKKGEVENKFFCVGIGAMVLQAERAERMVLVSFKKGFEFPTQTIWRTAGAR